MRRKHFRRFKKPTFADIAMLCEKVEEHGGLTDDDLADIDDLENPNKRYYEDPWDWGPLPSDDEYEHEYDDEYDDDDEFNNDSDDFDDELSQRDSYARYVDKLVDDVLTSAKRFDEADEDLRLLAKTKMQIKRIENMLECNKSDNFYTKRLEKRLKSFKRKYNNFLHGLL